MTTNTTHKHSKIKNRTTTAAFTGPVAAMPASLNPAAHHSLTLIDHCLCGATRLTNQNGDLVERGAWTGGNPNYARNEAAVSLAKLGKGLPITEKRRLALVENGKKPKGLRSERTEKLISTVEDGENIFEGGVPVSMQRKLFRIVTTGGRISWSARWFAGEELIKVENSTKKPVFNDE